MKKLAALVVLVALAGLALAYKNGTFDAPIVAKPGSHPWAARRDVPGVENFGEVVPGKVFRGAQPTTEGYESLKKRGVKTVISLRDWHDETKAVVASGLEEVRIPLEADLRSVPPTTEQIEKFLGTVLDPAKQPVYFHCAHGKDRTGTMCAILRMELDGWTNEEAWDEMQAFGFNQVWENLRNFVHGYKPSGRYRAAQGVAVVASAGVNALERR